MTVVFQKNRVYSLIVGTEEDAIEITDLQIKFEVTKTANNKEKKNQAKVEIYNLSRSRQKALEEDYVTVALRVGYADMVGDASEIPLLFEGQVVDLKATEEGNFLTRRSNTDLVTTLTIDELFSQLNGRVVSSTVPAGKTVKDAILKLLKDMPEITRNEISGNRVKTELVDGFPLSGTPRQILDQLARTYDLAWQIDNNILYVSDEQGAYTKNLATVPKIGQFSGLLERPLFKSEDVKKIRLKDKYKTKENSSSSKNKEKVKKTTVHCRILLNPTLVAGDVIFLEYEDISGYFKINEVTHIGDYRGNQWESKLILSVYEEQK